MRKRRRLIAMSIAAPLSLALWGGGMFKLYTILDGGVRQVAARFERALGEGIQQEQDRAFFVARVESKSSDSSLTEGATVASATDENCPLQIVRVQVRQAAVTAHTATAPKAAVRSSQTSFRRTVAEDARPEVAAVDPAPAAPSAEAEIAPQSPKAEPPKAPDPRMMVALSSGGASAAPRMMVVNAANGVEALPYVATKISAVRFPNGAASIDREELTRAIDEAMKQIKACPDLKDVPKLEMALKGISTRFIESNRFEFQISGETE